jgi:hypothetical protein
MYNFKNKKMIVLCRQAATLVAVKFFCSTKSAGRKKQVLREK